MMELITISIVLLALVYVIKHIRSTLSHGERQQNRCDNCAALDILVKKKKNNTSFN